MSVVGQAGSVADGVTAWADLRPDVVVTDLQMPDGHGLDVVRAIRETSDTTGLVVLTMHAGDEQIFAAMEAGASAFVGKDSKASEVVSAAKHAAVAPRTFLCAGLSAAMVRRATPSWQWARPTRRRQPKALRTKAREQDASAFSLKLRTAERRWNADASPSEGRPARRQKACYRRGSIRCQQENGCREQPDAQGQLRSTTGRLNPGNRGHRRNRRKRLDKLWPHQLRKQLVGVGRRPPYDDTAVSNRRFDDSIAPVSDVAALLDVG